MILIGPMGAIVGLACSMWLGPSFSLVVVIWHLGQGVPHLMVLLLLGLGLRGRRLKTTWLGMVDRLATILDRRIFIRLVIGRVLLLRS